MNALDAALDESVKVAKLREQMARDSFLTVEDLAKRYGLSETTIYRLPIPRTKIPGSSRVRFHPLDVLAYEQRERIEGRVTDEHIRRLERIDDPVLRDLHAVLSDIVGS